MLLVALLGVIVNLIAAYLLHGGDHHDLNLRSAWLHVVGDLLGSVAAIGAALFVMTLGWQRADPLLSLLAAVLILRSAWRVTAQSVHVLLEGTPSRLVLDDLRQAILTLDGVHDVHDLHVWSLSHREWLATLHLVVGDGVDRDRLIVSGRTLLAQRFGIQHATLQIEGSGTLAVRHCQCAVTATHQ